MLRGIILLEKLKNNEKSYIWMTTRWVRAKFRIFLSKYPIITFYKITILYNDVNLSCRFSEIPISLFQDKVPLIYLWGFLWVTPGFVSLILRHTVLHTDINSYILDLIKVIVNTSIYYLFIIFINLL